MIEDAVLKVWEESLVALALKLNVLFPLIKKFGFALIYILFDIFFVPTNPKFKNMELTGLI
jgi:hypothetical protein